MLPRVLVLLAACLIALPALAFESSARSAVAVIEASDLPAEARDTLEIVRKGGPFPYRKDGAVFRNRERRLPRQAFGYYREFTVPTPGAHDRGARRLIRGGDGDIHYTDDHYRTFRRVRE